MMKQDRDSTVGQYDLDWMIDLNRLHSAEVPRGFTYRRDRVYPFIHLKEGVLYSRFKTEYMKRQLGAGRLEPFGFFTETIALDLEIPDGESLVLRPEGGGETKVLLRYQPDHPTHQVEIKNTRDTAHADYPSDFRRYYDLFNETISAQYDFQEKSSPQTHPHNPVPRRRPPMVTNMKRTRKMRAKATCCGLECNPIYLGETSLKPGPP
jgi:hypothetical protein